MCVHLWRMSENVWGQAGLSEHEMDRGEGLKWLTEPVYISNSTLLWEGGRGEKTALQAKQSGIHFSVSSVFKRMLYVLYFLTLLPSMAMSSWLHVPDTEVVPKNSSVERLVLPPLLSIMSFIPWQGAHEEAVGIVALTHSGTTREERLKPSGWGGAGRIGGGSVPLPGRFGTQCNRSTFSLVNHCHPPEATRRALHVANPLCSPSQPSDGQEGNLIKRSWDLGDWQRVGE